LHTPLWQKASAPVKFSAIRCRIEREWTRGTFGKLRRYVQVIVSQDATLYDRYNIFSHPATEPGLATIGSRQPKRIVRRHGPNATATRIENSLLRREVAHLRAERDAVSRFVAEAEHGAERAGSLRDVAEAARAALSSAGAALYLYGDDRSTSDAHFAGYTDEHAARVVALDQLPRDLPAERSLLAHGQPLAITGSRAEPRRPVPAGEAHRWQTLIAPLRRAGQIIGSLQFSRAATGLPFSPQELALGDDLAALAGLIVGRFQQETLIRQRAARAEALREIGHQLSSELDFGRFLDRTAAHLMTLFHTRDCLLLSWDEAAQELTPELYIGGGERQVWRATIRPDERRGLTAIVIKERRTIHVANYLDACRQRGIEPVMPPGDWRDLAWVGVPLLAGGRLVGVIVVERHHLAFTTEEVAVLEALAGQLAAAMENARLYAEVRELAMTDPLTGLANRRHIHERLHQELERATRHERPLTVAMLDLDQFKVYNDTCGHQAGDTLLRRIAEILRAELRASDLAGRYGGDEFLLILPETAKAEAARLLARIRARLAALTAPAAAGDCPIVTTSAGLAAYPLDARDAHGLIALADAALYAEKRQP
jgi:diguanylate cyclase (GGDEF)-like protein